MKLMKLPNHRSKTIEELEGIKWPSPTTDASNLISECHRLRKLPLETLSIENLRILLGQEIGIKYLVPIAIEHLERDPWVEGRYFEGDLLLNVLRIGSDYWCNHQDQFLRFSDVMDALKNRMKFYENELLPLWAKIV